MRSVLRRLSESSSTFLMCAGWLFDPDIGSPTTLVVFRLRYKPSRGRDEGRQAEEMITQSYRYRIAHDVAFSEVEESLLLAIVAGEGLHGPSRARLETPTAPINATEPAFWMPAPKWAGISLESSQDSSRRSSAKTLSRSGGWTQPTGADADPFSDPSKGGPPRPSLVATCGAKSTGYFQARVDGRTAGQRRRSVTRPQLRSTPVSL